MISLLTAIRGQADFFLWAVCERSLFLPSSAILQGRSVDRLFFLRELCWLTMQKEKEKKKCCREPNVSVWGLRFKHFHSLEHCTREHRLATRRVGSWYRHRDVARANYWSGKHTHTHTHFFFPSLFFLLPPPPSSVWKCLVV